MTDRSELFSIFQNFYHEIKVQFGVPIRTLRSDNAREYLSHSFQQFMASNGILHQTSCAHTPQQNRVVERKNRHLIETTCTLLLHGNVPHHFWGDAVLTACYLINRLPSSILNNQVPHFVLFPHQSLHPLATRVFGSTCFVHNLSPGHDKLSARAHKCVFLGYGRSQKGYKCYSLTLKRYLISANVTFFESVPFFGSSTASESGSGPAMPLSPVPVVFHPPNDPPPADPPLRPLQVYHRQPPAAPLPSSNTIETPCDPPPAPITLLPPALSPETDLPIAL